MARIIYGGQLVNLCLLSKDLLNFEPPYRECWLCHWPYISNKTKRFSYKGGCGVRRRTCIEAFKRRAGLGYITESREPDSFLGVAFID